ncbi:MAG: hypothetical protein ACRC46_08230 [Thermoguttaceae bacterium]
MGKREPVDIDALLADGTQIIDAIRRGSREAMKLYIQAGESMVSCDKDGKVIMIPPEELQRMLDGRTDGFPLPQE